jgi:hypothetical protein
MKRPPMAGPSDPSELRENPEFAVVDAVYVARDEDLGIDNPLIRALPWFISVDSALAVFRNAPKFDPADRNLSVNARIHHVGSLSLYIELLTCHPELVEAIFRLITQGYTSRNPRINVQEVVRKNYLKSMSGKIVPIVPPKPSREGVLTLLGVSGVGKTTSLNRILSFLPPVIRHPVLTRSNLQVVWIKVDCPPDGSPKQLFRWMLLKFDSLLGTNYDKDVGKNAGLDRLMMKAAAVATLHHTGIIVIDEIQFAAGSAARRGDPLMDHLVAFINLVAVPVALSGTPKAMILFGKSFHLANRGSDQGSIIFTNMAFDREWESFLRELFKFQWLKEPRKVDEALSRTLYDLTQGVHALVIRLFQLSQIKAMKSKGEALTVPLLRDVAKKRFGPVQPMLDALKSKNKTRIELYDDLLLETLVGLTDEVGQETQAAQRKQAAKQRQNKDVQLSAVSALVVMGLNESQALKAVAIALAEDPSLTGEDLIKAACKMAPITLSRPQSPELQVQHSLSDIVRGAASPEEAIELLLRAGVINLGDTR